jgi:hypothetical protein
MTKQAVKFRKLISESACNSTDMQLSLLHPLGTVSHRVGEGDLKQKNQPGTKEST